MKPTLNVRQAMETRLSPQMVATMRLLQLPLLDFNVEIETMAQDNPVLEVTPPSDVLGSDAAREEEAKTTSQDEWDEEVLSRIAELADDPSAGGGSWAGRPAERDADWTDPILRLSPTKTLTEDLLEQVRLSLSGKEKEIGEFIVQDIDSRGFFTRPVDEQLARDIGSYIGKEVSTDEIEGVLAKLKEILEPPGVCASRVEESIGIQLERKGKGHLKDLLIGAYELLSRGKDKELSRLCKRHGVEESTVFKELSELHFVPTFGEPDEAFDTSSIRPEVLIVAAHPEKEGPEKYEVIYNNSAVVRVSLNPKIIEMARKRSTLAPEERQFLREKVSQAKWLRQMVDERKSLVLRTVEAIVRRQWEFLDKGRRYLKPLTQREIAQEVGRDESTISRVINGRFADTPQGCLPLSAFFSQAIGGASAEAARELLKEIIDNEPEGQAYTDDELAHLMRLRGIPVSRRVVNKYRKALGGHYALRRNLRKALRRRAAAQEQATSASS